MIGRMLMLLAMTKGVHGYPRPWFWAIVYWLYLAGSEHLFALMVGDWIGPLWKSALGFVVAYGTFWGMKETQDGLPYWGFFSIGFLLLTVVLP